MGNSSATVQISLDVSALIDSIADRNEQELLRIVKKHKADPSAIAGFLACLMDKCMRDDLVFCANVLIQSGFGSIVLLMFTLCAEIAPDFKNSPLKKLHE